MDDTGDDLDANPTPSFDDDDAPQPEVARIRRKVRSAGRDGRVRSKTIAPKRLTRDEKRLSELLVYPEDVDRPQSRQECSQMQRPCPFVSCSHHLYLDVNPETGAIKLNFPHLEVWEMAETCSLDVVRVDEQLREPALVAREALGRDRLRPHAAVAARRADLAADARDLGLRRVLVVADREHLQWRGIQIVRVVHSLLLGRSPAVEVPVQ